METIFVDDQATLRACKLRAPAIVAATIAHVVCSQSPQQAAKRVCVRPAEPQSPSQHSQHSQSPSQSPSQKRRPREYPLPSPSASPSSSPSSSPKTQRRKLESIPEVQLRLQRINESFGEVLKSVHESKDKVVLDSTPIFHPESRAVSLKLHTLNHEYSTQLKSVHAPQENILRALEQANQEYERFSQQVRASGVPLLGARLPQ